MSRYRFLLPLAFVLMLTLSSAAFAAPIPVERAAVSSRIFVPSTGCGCHPTLQQDWSQSMHSKALSDPLFLAKVAQGDKATGGQLGPFCKKCHGPIATITGEMGDPSTVSAEGITCSFCHQVVGSKGELGNTSQLVETDGIRRAQIENPQAPHPAKFSDLHKSAEICGGCHNVNHPVNGMHLESTYREWQKSSYAEQGIVCQDCHMSSGAGVTGPSNGKACATGPDRPNIYRMSFVGANAGQGPAEEAVARLKSAATIDMAVDDIVPAGKEASVTVTITNSGAGHYLPTGLTEFREMWLEVSAETTDGAKVKLGERKFGTVLADAKGHSPVELWDATRIASDDRIPPKGSVTAEYRFSMPEGASASKLTAALYYRSAPEAFAKSAGVANPVTEMAVAKAQVFASEQARASAAAAERPQQTKAQAAPKTRRPGTSELVAIGAALLAALVGVAFVFKRKS